MARPSHGEDLQHRSPKTFVERRVHVNIARTKSMSFLSCDGGTAALHYTSHGKTAERGLSDEHHSCLLQSLHDDVEELRHLDSLFLSLFIDSCTIFRLSSGSWRNTTSTTKSRHENQRVGLRPLLV